MEDKKNRILDAAKNRFRRFGVKKTSIEEVCRDIGISKKTLYEHFRNKEDLFASLFIREALANREIILKDVKDIQDPLEKVKKILRVAVDYHWHETFMFEVLKDQEDLYAPFLKEKYRLQVEEGILDIFTSVLQNGIDKGEFRSMDPHTVSYFIFKLFQSITYARTDSLKPDAKELDELIDFVFEGIVNKS